MKALITALAVAVSLCACSRPATQPKAPVSPPSDINHPALA